MQVTSWLQVQREIAQGRKILVDLRSEGEFALGAIAHAHNLPLLTNTQRREVGILYKQAGKAAATRHGLEVFATKAPAFMDQCQQLAAGSQGLVLYCWRGGMRSRLVGLWLTTAGIPVTILHGGYKGFRQCVREVLSKLSQREFFVLHGLTGSGKTALIEEMQQEGDPVLDFEGLAHHRGSAFGGMAQDKAPATQQGFENQLAECVLNLPPHSPLIVELETRIGPVHLDKHLRAKLCSSPMILLERTFSQRVAALARIYGRNWDAAAKAAFLAHLPQVQPFLPKDVHAAILAAAEAGELATIAAALLTHRYDKAYSKSLHRHRQQMLQHFDISHGTSAVKTFLREQLNHQTPAVASQS